MYRCPACGHTATVSLTWCPKCREKGERSVMQRDEEPFWGAELGWGWALLILVVGFTLLVGVVVWFARKG